MKKLSLKVLYLIVMTVVFGLALIVFFTVDVQVQEAQNKEMLAEEARVFAAEMDAVWEFIQNTQKRINYTSDGAYEFKGLHCAIVGKSVGILFSANNDYKIRYTNFNPRSVQGLPDGFEEKALTLFNDDRSQKEFYEYSEFNKERSFRYARALEVDSSCLECHGEPAGELDIVGYPREGWTLSSVGGAISIVIPVDIYQEVVVSNVTRDVGFFLLITIVIGGVIYFITARFVFYPLDKMKVAFSDIQGGDLHVTMEESHLTKEISDLAKNFNEMAREIKTVYSKLESEVADRTIELREANELLKKQRDILQRLNIELEQKTKSKDDLLSMVNHELRTPLTSIITFAEISKTKSASAADRQSWEEVEANGQALLAMINTMLDIARSDAGSIKTIVEVIDLGDIVSSVKATVVSLITKKRITFKASIDSDVPLIYGDYEKILRMLENLIGNAIKFTSEEGCIELKISYDAINNTVLILVSDSGIGIAQEDMERIFERFEQVDSTSTRHYGGSGLGLSLVKEYAALQNYSIAVESTLGKGSTFTIIIPKKAIVKE